MNKSILELIIKTNIPLSYDDVKHKICFIATTHCDTRMIKEYGNIACLYNPDHVFNSKGMLNITLENALHLYEKYPGLFRQEHIEARLYQFIKLYDKDIINKLQKRIEKK